MNTLYYTNDISSVYEIAKQHADSHHHEFYAFENNTDNIQIIISLYDTIDNATIFLKGLNKSPISNKLLKVLEENTKNIDIYVVSSTYDVSEPLAARFVVVTLDDVSLDKELRTFINTKKATKEVYSQLAFYTQLAWFNIHKKPNLDLIKIYHGIIILIN